FSFTISPSVAKSFFNFTPSFNSGFTDLKEFTRRRFSAVTLISPLCSEKGGSLPTGDRGVVTISFCLRHSYLAGWLTLPYPSPRFPHCHSERSEESRYRYVRSFVFASG